MSHRNRVAAGRAAPSATSASFEEGLFEAAVRTSDDHSRVAFA
jgi:hypothetical protein